jgi:hypothetical protein
MELAPAPRGKPQVEVAFDVEANGIVRAKDIDSGREIDEPAEGGPLQSGPLLFNPRPPALLCPPAAAPAGRFRRLNIGRLN